MSSIDVKLLREDLSFGVRVAGVSLASLQHESTRQQINALFEDRGMIVFEDVEPSSELHVALSTAFGPLKKHPLPGVAQIDKNKELGIIDIRHVPGTGGLVEIQGKTLANWLPWHFDHCYNNELNRAGVLRLIEIPPEGGMTGFADGIQLYQSLSPELRARIDGHKVIYTLNLIYANMRFGVPEGFRELKVHEDAYTVTASGAGMARAIHPAVWTRSSGEKVLHVSPWMAAGIEGHEDAEGDALLEAVCSEIRDKLQPYFHKWKPTDMLIWDNWRMLHCVSGHDPAIPRRMQRTTIKGDYGLGYFENGGIGGKLLEMTV
jgi:taurine dioxygenase